MKSCYDIIIRPVLTEKSYDGMAEAGDREDLRSEGCLGQHHAH